MPPNTLVDRAGSALVLLGVGLMAYAGLWQVGWAPGSRVDVPRPIALEVASAVARQPIPRPRDAVVPTPALPAPTAPAVVALVPPQQPATDVPPATSISAPAPPPSSPPGLATRLSIASIKLQTDVAQGVARPNADGELEWETLPFVAVHYGEGTARIGARSNAVIAGHVVTLSMGNVFRNLYRVNLLDEVDVWDDNDQLHRYEVVDIRLVDPSDVSVMAPTPDETLTLITCGGTFDPVKREFSDRLVVVARPLDESQAQTS